MMRRSQILSWAALSLGLVLLIATVWLIDFDAIRGELRSLGFALPLVLLVSGVWHLARTVAWAVCFPSPRRIGFWRLARVRLAAEAFSYLTLRGIAGEPLKVILLQGESDAREATAAVALERLSFIVLTMLLVGVGALIAIFTLPLSHLWFRVFRGFAIAAGVLGVFTVAILTGRGTYLGRLFGHRGGRVGRFIAAVERLLLELARHNPRRLAILALVNLICYVSMGLEVLIVLRAVGVPATFDESLAVETFSRVASFASSFIPANIGALEASSVAAVAAIGLTGGGAALAVARRIRGIFWAAVGLLIYPRHQGDERPARKRVLKYVARHDDDDASMFARVAGLAVAERVFRAAAHAGCGSVVLVSPGRERRLARLARNAGLTVASSGDLPAASSAEDADDDVPNDDFLIAEAGEIPRPGSGFTMMSARVRTVDDLPAAEREIREAVFKPTDHNLARFNRRLSLPLSVVLLRTPLTANQFSVGLLFLGLYSAWLFSHGTYLTGLVAAALSLAAGILDGCDGEIARLKHQESNFGCWLETVTDYTYYFAIFAGMTVGAVRYTGWKVFYLFGGLALAAMAASAMLLLFLRHRMTRHVPSHFAAALRGRFKEGGGKWTHLLAKLSNVATRAQMPYGVMALAVTGALPAVIILGAVGANLYWMALAWKLPGLLGDRLSIIDSRSSA